MQGMLLRIIVCAGRSCHFEDFPSGSSPDLNSNGESNVGLSFTVDEDHNHTIVVAAATTAATETAVVAAQAAAKKETLESKWQPEPPEVVSLEHFPEGSSPDLISNGESNIGLSSTMAEDHNHAIVIVAATAVVDEAAVAATQAAAKVVRSFGVSFPFRSVFGETPPISGLGEVVNVFVKYLNLSSSAPSDRDDHVNCTGSPRWKVRGTFNAIQLRNIVPVVDSGNF
ncbi:hypothetical protein CQW23_30192 [Capsicum baccatum]|uniref:Uncharacterized protein n=1 Tax=Capsicum baccatum TaxID=33114 RepID=A0A2G2VB50_CAPBA|nr:hypothetical protein CQW23_30192 [Capsicum baccatum]